MSFNNQRQNVNNSKQSFAVYRRFAIDPSKFDRICGINVKSIWSRVKDPSFAHEKRLNKRQRERERIDQSRVQAERHSNSIDVLQP